MDFRESVHHFQASATAPLPESTEALDSQSPTAAHQPDRIRVLLVDDHALVRAGLRALIEMIEALDVVGEAGNGAEALRATEHLEPQIVLLDITMPDMNGLEVLQEITARFAGVKVIILTMHEAREYAVQALHFGAAGFIPKSAAAAELKDAIETVMQGKTYVSAQTPQQAARVVITDEKQRDLLNRLTPRQREILVRIAEGQSTKEIARALDISVKTVESHRSQLTERLSIHDVAGLVRFAIKAGLINV
ncbi:MAG TPA: response regulator transcription factor [Pyrinomonadaceae bacterium]|nr:response regulator transcription factor [Pyrinomonadaceae bacterium]